MFSYEKDLGTEIEDIMQDFLDYRRARRAVAREIRGQDLGRGWPNYKSLPFPEEAEINVSGSELTAQKQEEIASKQANKEPEPVIEQIANEPEEVIHQEVQKVLIPSDPVYEQSLPSGELGYKFLPLPENYNSRTSENEVRNLHKLYSYDCKILRPYVQEALSEFERSGVISNDEYLDRETLIKITDRVKDKTKYEAMNNWSRSSLTQDLIELLTINELYCSRRPGQRLEMRESWGKLQEW